LGGGRPAQAFIDSQRSKHTNVEMASIARDEIREKGGRERKSSHCGGFETTRALFCPN